MYSLRRHPNHSYYHSQYWTMDCRQQQQEFLFRNRHMFKSRQQCFSSTKFLNQKHESSHRHSSQKNTLKSTHSSNSQDISLPVYRAPCTFQNSLITTDKGRRTSLSSPLSTQRSFSRWFIIIIIWKLPSITSVFIIIIVCT